MSAPVAVGRRVVALDAAVLLVVVLGAASPLADAYAGRRWAVAIAGGVLLAAAATLLARRLQWGAVLTTLLLVVLLVLVGPALAAPDHVRVGVLPTPTAEHELLTGVVDGWRNALTLPVPLGTDYRVLVVPLVIGVLGGLAATTFLWRTRWPSIAGLAVVAVFVTAAAFGSRAAELPWARGVALTVVVLVWLRWRALRTVRTSWTRRVALTGAVLAVAGAAGVGLAVATAGDDRREVLRDYIDPPLEELAFKSPLAKFRDYYLEQESAVLFRVDGLPEGARVRLATMDQFDGIVWNVSTVDATTGSAAFERASASDSSNPLTVTIEDYTGPWVPTVGGSDGVTLAGDPGDRQLLTNPETGAVAMLGDVRRGDVFTVDWEPVDAPTDAGAVDGTVRVVPPDRKLPQLDKIAQGWVAQAGAAGGLDTAGAISDGFAKNGFFSDGRKDDPVQVPAGHGARRIANLVADPGRMIGNEEQYASALAVELQTLQMPARVVLGFSAEAGPEITGDDVDAWVEVKSAAGPWVELDPTPPETQTPTVLTEDPDPEPQPNVVQPPILPNEPDEVGSSPPPGAGQDLASKIWDIILMILGWLWSAFKLAAVLSPLWGLLLAKRRRRRRRRTADDPVTRMSGGWREVTDRARDLGTTLPRSQTRYESSVVLAERYPDASLPPLATVADRHVFGPVPPTQDEVDAYWADVDTALKRMRRAAPWWRRPLAWFSPASIPWRAVGADVAGRAARAAHAVASSRIGVRVTAASRTAWSSGRGLMSRIGSRGRR